MPQEEKPPSNVETIRKLNDDLRQHAKGNGSILITAGVQALGADKLLAISTAIIAFDDFTKDNDPFGEHDFGGVEVLGEKVVWKIDYYDRSIETGSLDPTDESVTHRVLTIMLASEY